MTPATTVDELVKQLKRVWRNIQPYAGEPGGGNAVSDAWLHRQHGRHYWGINGKTNHRVCFIYGVHIYSPVNPRPTGGGLFRAPPLVFLRYLLNQCRYHHQTCSTLSPNNFTHCVKILKSRVLLFGHKWRQSDVMFRRFRPKIRVYGNRRHGCSFKATINFLIWNDVELVVLQNWYLGC